MDSRKNNTTSLIWDTVRSVYVHGLILSVHVWIMIIILGMSGVLSASIVTIASLAVIGMALLYDVSQTISNHPDGDG